MAEYRVPIKYAFPLFTKHNSTDYLIKHDQIGSVSLSVSEASSLKPVDLR